MAPRALSRAPTISNRLQDCLFLSIPHTLLCTSASLRRDPAPSPVKNRRRRRCTSRNVPVESYQKRRSARGGLPKKRPFHFFNFFFGVFFGNFFLYKTFRLEWSWSSNAKSPSHRPGVGLVRYVLGARDCWELGILHLSTCAQQSARQMESCAAGGATCAAGAGASMLMSVSAVKAGLVSMLVSLWAQVNP